MTESETSQLHPHHFRLAAILVGLTSVVVLIVAGLVGQTDSIAATPTVRSYDISACVHASSTLLVYADSHPMQDEGFAASDPWNKPAFRTDWRNFTSSCPAAFISATQETLIDWWAVGGGHVGPSGIWNN